MTPQEELYKALSESVALIAYVPAERIFGEYPSLEMFGSKTVETHFPRITYVLTDRSPTLFADNQPVMDILQFNIDIWLADSTIVTYTLNTIKLEIDKIMLTLGYFKLTEEEKRKAVDKIENLSLSYVKEFPSNL